MHVICPALEPTRSELSLIREGLSRRTRDHRCEQACAAVVEAWERIIRWLARHYAPNKTDVDDFSQVGRMALLRAFLKFPPERSGRFEHYARRAIRNALIDEARRVQLQQCERSLEHEGALREDTALTKVIRLESRALVRRRVAGLAGRLPTLFDLLFVKDLKQAEAARVLGLTPARISQLCRQLRSEFADLAALVNS